MELGYKEKLSAHVEKIFKSYTTPGLHICDIATGGGKSYTIGKLTCEYYPLHFDRIITKRSGFGTFTKTIFKRTLCSRVQKRN